MVNGISLPDPTPYDGLVTLGYETGSFDGYALTVTVTDGFVTVQAGVGALDPKINFIEIAPVGTVIDAPTSLRVQAAAVQATHDTAKPKAKVPPTVKRNVWGVYVDELVSYTVQKPRKSPVRYYTHANPLYSIAATTNTSGAVVERYCYNAYGVRTVKNSAGATLAKSAVNQDRGFTSYKVDLETGLYFARARMYSPKLGRFVGRDPWRKYSSGHPISLDGYVNGMNLYTGYFAPNSTDPTGRVDCRLVGAIVGIAAKYACLALCADLCPPALLACKIGCDVVGASVGLAAFNACEQSNYHQSWTNDGTAPNWGFDTDP
jgi:RHS repeat-associated protein